MIDSTIQTLIIEAIHLLQVENFEPKFIVLGYKSAYELFILLMKRDDILVFPDKYYGYEIIIDPTKSDYYIGVLPNNDRCMTMFSSKYKNMKLSSRE